jgi:hypothetical protein
VYGVARNMDVLLFPETGVDIDCRLALAGPRHPSDQTFVAVGEQARVTTPWCILIVPVGVVIATKVGHRWLADSFPAGDVASGVASRKKSSNASSLLRRDLRHTPGKEAWDVSYVYRRCRVSEMS